VRGMQSGGLLRRVRWPVRGGRDEGLARPRPDTQPGIKAAPGKRRCALDWQQVQAHLGPVRHRWDLAILCNMDENAATRPAGLLAAINAQAGTGRQLSPQVLSGRLRELEQDGYVRHEDLSVIPLHRVYYLQPMGQRLIMDLSAIVRQAGRSAYYRDRAAGTPSVPDR
jgi:DNA-binding HxlR family transcriptional regulator